MVTVISAIVQIMRKKYSYSGYNIMSVPIFAFLWFLVACLVAMVVNTALCFNLEKSNRYSLTVREQPIVSVFDSEEKDVYQYGVFVRKEIINNKEYYCVMQGDEKLGYSKEQYPSKADDTDSVLVINPLNKKFKEYEKINFSENTVTSIIENSDNPRVEILVKQYENTRLASRMDRVVSITIYIPNSIYGKEYNISALKN